MEGVCNLSCTITASEESTSAGVESSTSHGASVRKLRVLHLINGEHYAGAERVQDLLGKHLPALGVDPAFVCLKEGRFAMSRECSSAPLWSVPMKNRLDLRVAWKIAQIARAERIDILHAHTVRSVIAARIAASLARLPLVYHVHSPALRDTTDRLRNWGNAAAERIGLFRAQHMICVSQSLRNYMLDRGYDPARVSVVPNGVPIVEPFEFKAPPKGTWTIGTVALIRPRKGIEVLLDAAAFLRNSGTSIRLRIIGPFETSEYEQSLRQRVERLKITELVEWVGFTRQVPAELRKLDLFVLPSLFGEGMPMVVLESMTAGVPVVASDVEGIPEAIRHGVDGWIVEPNDSVKLAAGISRIVRGEVDYSSLRQSARKRHIDRFSAEAMARGVAKIYRRVLAEIGNS